MNKDFSQKKLLSFSSEKILKVLLDLASFIEKNSHSMDSTHYVKLQKYHLYLQDSENEFIQKANKEFSKIQSLNYQFQVYMMNLERFVGQSSSEYEFLVKKNDGGQERQALPLVCILDSIRSAHNVGAILRNAECFGVKKVYLTGLSPSADHPQVIKTSMGCHETVDWEYQKEASTLIDKLIQEGYEIISVETAKEATELEQIRSLKVKKIALIFGHEQHGVSLELLKKSHKCISIKLHGEKNSLNVAVSAGIVLQKFSNLLDNSE